jgi:hypothetical protein
MLPGGGLGAIPGPPLRLALASAERNEGQPSPH